MRISVYLATATASLLAACTTPHQPQLDAHQLQRFEAQGYLPGQDLGISPLEDVRLLGQAPARLVWLMPDDAQTHPLLIYMPGLGQDAHAYAHSREKWARSGYAVLSWQPLPEDEKPASPKDQGAWAATRFADQPLTQRVDLLGQLLAKLQAAQAQGDQALKRVDLNHVGLTGFDLGALTVMHAAGEASNGQQPPTAGLRLPHVEAFIAISPYASFKQGAFDTRYRQIHGAVLTLTSDQDVDANGVVPAAYLRMAPFGGMPPGDKYMLILKGSRHAALGEMRARDDSGPLDVRQASGEDDQPVRAHQRADSKGRADHAGPGPDRQASSPTLAAMQQSAQADVSVAFLDAYVRQDPLARQWLQSQAGRWLTPVGDWLAK